MEGQLLCFYINLLLLYLYIMPLYSLYIVYLCLCRALCDRADQPSVCDGRSMKNNHDGEQSCICYGLVVYVDLLYGAMEILHDFIFIFDFYMFWCYLYYSFSAFSWLRCFGDETRESGRFVTNWRTAAHRSDASWRQ